MIADMKEKEAAIKGVILGLLAHIKGFGKTRSEMAVMVYLADNILARGTGESITGAVYFKGEIEPRSEDGIVERAFDSLAADELTIRVGYAPWREIKPADSYRLDIDEYPKGYAAAKALGAARADAIRMAADRYKGLRLSELRAVARDTDAYKGADEGGALVFERSANSIARERWEKADPRVQEFKAQAAAALKDMKGKEWISHEDLMADLGVDDKPMDGFDA